MILKACIIEDGGWWTLEYLITHFNSYFVFLLATNKLDDNRL